MDWIKFLYLVSVVILWICIGINFWNIGRNRRLRKNYESMIQEVELIYREYRGLCYRYEELLIEQEKEDDNESV